MKIDDTGLLAYVDGELSADECVQVEKALRESEDLAARVSLLRAEELPYQDAFGKQSLPSLPESLSRNVDALIRQHLASASAERDASFDECADDGEPIGDNVYRLKPRTRWVPRFSWPTLVVAT